MLQFDFSSVQAGTLAEIEARFTKHVRECVTSFAVKYAKLADWSRVENTTTVAEMVNAVRAVIRDAHLSPLYVIIDEYDNFTNAAAEKGKVLGRSTPDAETVEQALAYRKALARRPDWDHPIKVAVVEVCGNTGYNWFDL